MTAPKSVNDMTRDELRAEAKGLKIPGRGSMTAAQLRENVAYFREESVRAMTREMLEPSDSDRYRDRVARGELIVATPNGAAPAVFRQGRAMRTYRAPGAVSGILPYGT